MRRTLLAAIVVPSLVLAACGGDEDAAVDSGAGAEAADGDLATVVVTTSILGDVVAELVGDQLEVVTIMPPGADPHTFSASAQQANAMRTADALIVNGGGFEEGLIDVVEGAEADGVEVFEALSVIEPIEFAEGDGHADDGHSDDGEEHSDEGEHSDEEEHSEGEHSDKHDDPDHDHEGEDPHFFTDPARMALAAEGIVEFLSEAVDGIDAEALAEQADGYLAELEALDEEVESILAAVPEERRVLVTNHEVFGYFADRYGFEVLGAVIPGGGTGDSVSPGALSELAELLRAEGVPAVFADASSPNELAQALASEVGADVAVVELFSESLGEPGSDGDTYLGMLRANASRIADALG